MGFFYSISSSSYCNNYPPLPSPHKLWRTLLCSTAFIQPLWSLDFVSFQSFRDGLALMFHIIVLAV
ncbi:hypothetical protein EXN66_Car013216 [Channa argus]|uniref:Uncharacterized protein n=1 Tax=Channa argus TaxID=215402 RepID=A0A6G1Q5T0_CHAAH|nr:hypothetical protein EXN66_Car013216 [Channa argus]